MVLEKANQGWNMADGHTPALIYETSLQPGVVIWPPAIEQALANVSHRVKVLKPLQYSLGVIIPGTNGNVPTNNVVYRDQLIERIIKMPGVDGVSYFEWPGVYKTRSGTHVWENNWLVKCYLDREALLATLPIVLDFACFLLEELSQEAIALEINQQLLLVERP